jgi:hypothetical protein
MLQFRDRVEELRVTKCLGEGGERNKPYGYFQSIFSEQKWPKYLGGIQATQSSIVAAIREGIVNLST